MEELSKHKKTCIKCGKSFEWNRKQSYWDYTGYSDIKVVNCPACGCKNPIKYKEQTNPNYDSRLFYY